MKSKNITDISDKCSKDWFESWFDTHYYHILYKDRDFSEAELFINNLMRHLQLPKSSAILDLACGKGRHALQLSELGYNVKGVDLSENSIKEASKKSNKNLTFEVGDMRCPIAQNHFDGVLNLFTSFGYFNSMTENIKVLHCIEEMLKPNGIFVIDFMNSNQVTQKMIPFEKIEKENITFEIFKKLENNQIIKTIQFEDQGRNYKYEEKVQALTLNDFNEMFSNTNMEIAQVFGDYHLNAFDEKDSDRLILIGKKIQ